MSNSPVMAVLTLKITTLDNRLNDYLTTFRKPWLLKIIRGVTHLGSGAFWAAVYSFTLLFFREVYGPLVFTILVAELIVFFIILPLRYFTRRERPRPYFSYLPFTPWNRYSFPSHHAARMFMLAFLVSANYRGLFIFMLSVAIIIGFTRIFLEKHYLSDVMAGAALGIILGSGLDIGHLLSYTSFSKGVG